MEFKIVSDLWRCVWWKIELPRIDTVYESPAFSFDTKTFTLRLRGFWNDHEKCEEWKVCYTKSTHTSGIETLVYIEDKSEKFRLAYCGQITDMNCIYHVALMTRKTLKNVYGLADENTISMLFVFNLDSTHSKDILEACSSTTTETIEEIQPSDMGLLSLSEDINKLFNNEKHSDAVLRCGDRCFFVNKELMSARSDVFATMFRTKMSESETGVVEIQNMEPSILEQFLRFIYSGKIENMSMDSACDLYDAGEKYAIPSLKWKCALFMVDNLSEENVCQVLLLADVFQDAELSDRAACFVLRADGFLGSDKWNDFARQHATAAVKVYMKYHEKIKFVP